MENFSIEPPKPAAAVSKEGFQWTKIILAFTLGALLMGALVYFYQQQKIDKMQIAFANRGLTNMQNSGQNLVPSASALYGMDNVPLPVSVKKQDFAEASLVKWLSNDNAFALTGLEWGTYEVTPEMAMKGNWTKQYSQKKQVNLIVLKLKVTTGESASSCVDQTIRMELNGDKFQPLNRQFIFPDSHGCVAAPNSTYKDMLLYFESPAQEDAFTFTDGKPRFTIYKNSSGGYDVILLGGQQ
ncbi:MAG: hypothetical protein HY918_04180 [Candidatus Doudnabacteria bacterium]|nr:hypothetical protein [Candidatus Doudnabacteria bacterium]